MGVTDIISKLKMKTSTNCCLFVLNKELHSMIANSNYSKKNRTYKCIMIPLEIENINLQIALTVSCNTKTKTDGILAHYIQYKKYKIYPSTKYKTVLLLKKAIMKVKMDA